MVSHIFSKGEESMNNYRVTVFQPNGEKILDEAFQAQNDETAKEQGLKILSEKDLLDHTYRCTSPKGKLLLFHS
jgi:hypothetical protein